MAHIKRLEVLGVSSRDCHSRGLRDSGDEGVIDGGVLGNPVRREDSRGRLVKRQDSVGERGHDISSNQRRKIAPWLASERPVDLPRLPWVPWLP